MEQKKRYNVLKAAIWYTIGNILIRGISFFLLPIFTSLMTTTDYGIYSVYTSYLMIFETVVLFGLSSTVSMAKFSNDINFESYIATIILMPILFTFLVSIFVNVYLKFFGQLFSMNITLWNFLFFTAATASIMHIINSRLVLEGKYKVYMICSLGYVLGNAGISLLLCFTFFSQHDIYLARVIGQCIPNFVISFFLFFSFTKRQTLDIKLAKTALAWGFPLLLHTSATVLMTQSDRIIIKHFVGYSDTGIYSIAITIVTIPMLLATSLNNAKNPWILCKLSKREYPTIVKANNKFTLLFAFIIAEFVLVSPEIIHIFTDVTYWDSIYSLIPLSISVFGEMIYSMPTGVETINKKTWYMTTATTIALVINVILDIVFVANFSYIGAAYATTISKIILFCLHCVFAKKVDRNPIFSKGIVVACLVFLVVINFFGVATVEYIIIRYIVMLFIGFVALKFLWKDKSLVFLMMHSK